MKVPHPVSPGSVRLTPAWHQTGFWPSDRVRVAHQPPMIDEITSGAWRLVPWPFVQREG